MDSFGYKNWGGRDSYDDSYESSPPTYASDQYGFTNSNNNSNKDIYDFDISQEADDSPIPKPKKSLTRTREVRRKSTDERVSEILEKSKKSTAKSEAKTNEREETEEDIYSSWKSSWNQLMDGLDVSSQPSPNLTMSETPKLKPSPPQSRSPLDHSDSFEISAADLEVNRF